MRHSATLVSGTKVPSFPSRAAVALVLALGAGLPAQQAVEPVDEAAVAVLRKHGLEHSEVMEHLSWMCDVYGPRLTGSTNLRKAQDWATGTLTSWGWQNARLEEWGPFGRGWELEHANVAVVGDNPWPVIAYPKAWSPGIEGRVVAEVIDVGGMDAQTLEAMDLSDKVVLIEEIRPVEEHWEGTARRFDDTDLLSMANGSDNPKERERAISRAAFRQGFARRQAMMKILWEKRPLALLDRSYKGDYGTVFVSSVSVPSDPETPRSERPRPWTAPVETLIPQFTVAVEHYNRMARLIAKGQKVEIALELRTRFVEGDPMQRNVIAEIPGTDPDIGQEVVMFGAHFDSWHTGTGATDNGCGSAVMMEAARLLTKLIAENGQGPRRTLRIALWSGEEQGLLGSRAFVAKHLAVPGGRDEPPQKIFPAHRDLAGYYNLDNGTGRIRGVYLQGNTACAPIFRQWLRPFHDLGAATITPDDTGGTDHLAFDAVGLPGFQFIQDPVAYSTRTHHSNMDNWDHAVAEDLQQAATIIASFVWHTSQRDAKLPRETMTLPATIEASAPARRDGGR